MAAYANSMELREYLPQLPTDSATVAAVAKVLARATAIIDRELGYSFGTAAVGTEVVYGDGTDYLKPPTFVEGSVTGVTTLTGYTVPSYVEQDGILVVTRESVKVPYYARATLSGAFYASMGGWLAGVPYTVAATYGHAAVPEAIKEACLEIAVDLWRFRDAGSIKVVGVEGAGVVKGRAIPATARAILDSYGSGASGGVR